MQVEEKFNIKTAALITTQSPVVDHSFINPDGVRVRLYPAHVADQEFDKRTLTMHLSPLEALEFAENLVHAARKYMAAMDKNQA